MCPVLLSEHFIVPGMKYYIDYRNGGMGNTVLSHILYACKQVDINLDHFFNETGHAHNILDYNKSNLEARHLAENPRDNVNCILEIYHEEWTRLLRIKMSYSKWMNDTPTLQNYKKFRFNFKITPQSEQASWQDFYQDLKDPAWPECNDINDVVLLPEFIQKEIADAWQDPEYLSELSTENDFIELLTKTYYDNFCSDPRTFKTITGISLENYLDGDFSVLINLSKNILNWQWDQRRSQLFFNKVIETNQLYLQWLDNIKCAVYNFQKNLPIEFDFEPWEQAIIIAKACQLTNFNPINLNWKNSDCKTFVKNIYLEEVKKDLSWQNHLT